MKNGKVNSTLCGPIIVAQSEKKKMMPAIICIIVIENTKHLLCTGTVLRTFLNSFNNHLLSTDKKTKSQRNEITYQKTQLVRERA